MNSAFISITDWPIDLWAVNGFAVFALSVILTGILIPKILLISFRRRLFDVPDARKIHHGAVPRLGGIAFMPAIILSMSFVAGLNLIFIDRAESSIMVDAFGSEALQLCFGLCALMMMYLVGIADDLIGVKYRAKFFVQILAALLMVSSGMTINNLYGFLGLYELPDWAAIGLTVITILLIINAVNLIDGIDGLASGLSAIALGFYAFVCFDSGNYTYAMLSLATVGTLVPFFYFNVFGDIKVGRKIFMGDTGALTTGLILSFVAIKVVNVNSDHLPFADSPAILAFTPLLVPCLDVVRVFFHRLSRGHSPFQPGRTHIHHKFLALGIKQRYAMLLIMFISLGYIALNIFLSTWLPVDIILVIDLFIWVLANYFITKAIHRRQLKKPETAELYN